MRPFFQKGQKGSEEEKSEAHSEQKEEGTTGAQS